MAPTPAKSIEADVSDEEADDRSIPVTIIASSSGIKKTVTISLATKVSEFRQRLASDEIFGVSPALQRLFYMGRELKNGGRTLSGIGLGSFQHTVVHLHRRPTSTSAATSSTAGSKRERKSEQIPKRRRVNPTDDTTTSMQQPTSGPRNEEVVDLLDSSDSESGNATPVINRESQRDDEVIELLDSDSDSEQVYYGDDDSGDDDGDDDDDEVELSRNDTARYKANKQENQADESDDEVEVVEGPIVHNEDEVIEVL